MALCQLDRGFYGIGCPHPGVECLIGQVTKLLVHYGCTSGLGIKMQVTMELFATELGLSLQPFQESFAIYGRWRQCGRRSVNSTSQSGLPFCLSILQEQGINGSCRSSGNPGLWIQENWLSSTDFAATNKFYFFWMSWMRGGRVSATNI